MTRIKSIVASLAIAFASFTASAGQTSSDFRGQVVDLLGRPVVGAIMVVENLDIGHISRHVSGKTGRWHAQASGPIASIAFRATPRALEHPRCSSRTE